ncbi:MAG: hypothetical protein GY950_13310 [bacterium]|nr:hypothetical protein [bacterium]
MYTIKNYLKLVLVFSVILVASTAGLAEEPETEPRVYPVADVNMGANAIHWLPTVDYNSLVLSVSTPEGAVFRKTFGANGAPHLELTDDKGNYLPDGNYTYELRVIPVVDKKIRGVSKEIYRSKALTQSGSFVIRGGKFVVPAASEVGDLSKPQQGEDDISKTQDICYVDDLIDDGSLCVGLDCTCNYSFGFDTIVLKENNLRIFFDDTSTGASFPRNDWRIVINDSANGGASYFGVEDSTAGRRVFTLEAGAPSHSLYVDDGGRVGLGTSIPSVDAHIVSGNTPTVRLEQDGSSGFAPQTFDVAGNETNFFIRDVTNGSTLPFRIQPDAPNNVLTIRADGRVGIGTWSPTYPIHLLTNSSTNAGLLLERTSGATFKLNATSSLAQIGSQTNHKLNFVVNNSAVMTLDTTGYMGIGATSPGHPIEVTIANGAYLNTSGNWVNPSSRKLKENIRSLTTEEAVDTLNGLNPVKYNYKVDNTETCAGFIAEDVPDLVAVKDRKGMVTMDVVAVLTKVVKEQQKIITKLNERIEKLEKE